MKGYCGNSASPKGPCRYMVYTSGPKGSHTPTLRPKYVVYSYTDPLGSCITLSTLYIGKYDMVLQCTEARQVFFATINREGLCLGV